MKDNYPKAYKEVLEILKYLPQESIDKIPKDLLYTFEYNKDKNYKFNIEEGKCFDEQILLDETKAILANIFRDYWATSKQKERIDNKQNYDRKLLEEQKQIKYDPNNIFKNKEKQCEENNLPIEVKKDNFISRLVTFIKKIFMK